MSRKKSTKQNGRDNKELFSVLWEAANNLRGNINPSEYQNVVLGLIFLKYISDAFEEKRNDLRKELENQDYSEEEILGALEDRDEYEADNVFWVPEKARWELIHNNSKKEEIGLIIDEAMRAIEEVNKKHLLGILPKRYARPELDKIRLGKVVDLISDIGLGDKESQSKDILGNVYEYFLSKFALIGGEVFTPKSIVKTLVAMLQPYKGRVFDPCCGSGGMFVQSEEFVQEHGGKIDDISIIGQEFKADTWKLAKMNLAIRQIEPDLGKRDADSFLNNQHKNLKADFVLANPPFNDSHWGGDQLEDDVRWKYGKPPNNNANFAWVQHFLHHLAPKGLAGFVLANGSLSSMTSGEGDIRQAIIEDDLVDCIISLPGQLFLTTQIPVCLWFLSKNKDDGKFRNRKGETLFIDARKFGYMVDRVRKAFTDEDIETISSIYLNWKSKEGDYEDEKGLCKSISLKDIAKNNFVLTPGRYVGIEEQEVEWEDFKSKFEKLTKDLNSQLEVEEELSHKLKMVLGDVMNDT
ncbi:MAG: type I restriction-modification system subunit M [Candidatus Heimdallarchaeota archaeon]|nr:type I restriction-modification system subunit M [Candidatus Heimdallarchaeota archaeon]